MGSRTLSLNLFRRSDNARASASARAWSFGRKKVRVTSHRSGRSPEWLKMKNSNAPAVKREAEEDWGKERWR